MSRNTLAAAQACGLHDVGYVAGREKYFRSRAKPQYSWGIRWSRNRTAASVHHVDDLQRQIVEPVTPETLDDHRVLVRPDRATVINSWD
jgi:hypothetical protein